MRCLSDEIENEKVILIESFKDLRNVKNLEEKSLCIIKTDFKNLSKIKNFMQKYPLVKVWLTSEEISRKSILNANLNGFETVVQYPVDLKIIRNFLRKPENDIRVKDSYAISRGNNAKIMIVDDNPMNIELLIETLSSIQLEIRTFIKPIDAIKAIENETFDLFLLDIMMPDISGFDLAKIIKNSKLNATTPIIFISALSDTENKIRGYDLGSYAYIEKPFDIKVVRAQILNVLKTKALQESLLDKKETFFALVTHDLKSPVAAEITALEYLINNYSSKMNPMQSEILGDILEAAKYMKLLVDNVLNKYKFDNGELKIHTQIHSLDSIVIECIEETKYLYCEKNQTIKYSCPYKNTDVNVDYLEIKRVIHNILSNAYEYGTKNTQILINIDRTDKKIVFHVTNEGNGINLKNSNDIFDKFVSNAKEQKKIGTGLGLYVSKKIIEAHGGKIFATSIPSKSTTISFELDSASSTD